MTVLPSRRDHAERKRRKAVHPHCAWRPVYWRCWPGCGRARRGRAAAPGGEAARLREENERLRRDCQRQQALVRLARQAAGLSPPPEPAPPGGKKRRCREVGRGRRAAERLRQAASAAAAEPGGEPAATLVE